MEFFEQKNSLIKDHIPRNINSSLTHIQALKPFMDVDVSKKDTVFGPELKFTSVIGTKVWPTGATNHRIIRFLVQESLKRSLIMNNLTRKSIDEICGCYKGPVTKF